MKGKRIVAALRGDGHIVPVEQDIPETIPGSVLIEVHRSLVSPGTELRGWRGLAAKLSAPASNDPPRPFGYANAGIVAEVGEGVTELKPGDRVAAIGAGYAQHTNWARVPHNLVFRLADDLTFDQGVYTMLAATGLMAVRRGQAGLGEYWAVVGLGIVGQCTAMLLQQAGCYVIGWDLIPGRVETARGWGIHQAEVPTAEMDMPETTRAFTGGYGLDGAVLAFPGDGTQVINNLVKAFQVTPDTHVVGRIINVGGSPYTLTGQTSNLDIRRSSRTGPGYHDEKWEYGEDYPPVFMRWTTRTNVALCLRFMQEGRMPVDRLTTHHVPLDNVEAEMLRLMENPDQLLGVIFDMTH